MGARGTVGIRLNWIRRSSLPDVTAPNYRHLHDEYARRIILADTPARLLGFEVTEGLRPA